MIVISAQIDQSMYNLNIHLLIVFTKGLFVICTLHQYRQHCILLYSRYLNQNRSLMYSNGS